MILPTSIYCTDCHQVAEFETAGHHLPQYVCACSRWCVRLESQEECYDPVKTFAKFERRQR